MRLFQPTAFRTCKQLHGVATLCIRSASIVFLFTIEAQFAYAQVSETLDRKSASVDAPNQTHPHPSTMEFVSKLLQTELKKDSKPIGKVEDIALDLETEHLALLIASNGTAVEARRFALLPFIPGDQLVQFDWEKNLTLNTQPVSAARFQASELYRDYKRNLYWIDFAKKKRADANEIFDEEKFALTFYSMLKNKVVVDNAGRSVGKIVDVAIGSSNGAILYLVMESEDKSHRAIPLGAFVNEKENDEWLIELTMEQILNFKPFLAKSPPSGVDRGWEEYVSVRYGRGGLQARKKKDQ